MTEKQYTDAHNHSHELPPGEQLDPLISRCVTNGSSPADWDAVAAFATTNQDRVIPAYGLHPWFIETAAADWQTQLRHRIDADPNATLGECGLDRTRRSPELGLQEPVFRQQLQLASEFDRALTLHCVGAWGRLFEILRTEPLPNRGVMLHGYTAPIEMLDDFLAVDTIKFSLCFSAPKPPARELLLRLPIDRVLIESDATAANGRHPTDVAIGHQKFAEFHGEPLPQVAAQVAANFDCLFSPPASL